MTDLPENVLALKRSLSECTLCPRCCRVNRLAGQVGACQTGPDAVVASAGAHFGEESVLVGRGGSGAIFFSGCNLHCAFCGNCDISQRIVGEPHSAGQLAALALSLSGEGCENVNFVTPTHVAHAVAEAVVLARSQGLRVPAVYNCGGYESIQTLRLLEGLIDIYMPDFKWADDAAGSKYSDAAGYPAVAEQALQEMFRQVGPLQLDQRGRARRGVLVRHLVMPNDLARSDSAIEIIARAAPGCAINVMGQYRPAYRAQEFPELLGPVDLDRVQQLREHALRLGLVHVG